MRRPKRKPAALPPDLMRQISNDALLMVRGIAAQAAGEAMVVVCREVEVITSAFLEVQQSINRERDQLKAALKLVTQQTVDLKRMHMGYWRFINEKVKEIRLQLAGATADSVAKIVRRQVHNYDLEKMIRDEVRTATMAAVRAALGPAPTGSPDEPVGPNGPS